MRISFFDLNFLRSLRENPIYKLTNIFVVWPKPPNMQQVRSYFTEVNAKIQKLNPVKESSMYRLCI